MRLFLFFFIVTICFSQNYQETITKNQIRFTFTSNDKNGELIAIPDLNFKIIKSENCSAEYLFTKRNNKFLEFNTTSNRSELILEFEKDISNYSREIDNISFNHIFYNTSRNKSSLRKKAHYFTDSKSIKIYTDKKGVYKIDFSHFSKFNINISGINTNEIKMFNKGKEIPILIKSGDDFKINQNDEYILFLAELNLNTNFKESDDLYLDPYDFRNIYWLTIEDSSNTPGKRLYLENSSPIERNQDNIFKPTYFDRFEHLELNNFNGLQYLTLVEDENSVNLPNNISNRGFFHHRDFNFWGDIVQNTYKSFDISVLDNYYSLNNDSVTFKIMLSGSANKVFNGSHGVNIKISSFDIELNSSPNWIKQYKKSFNIKIPVKDLRTSNSFEIQTIVNNDRILLNWIEIKFKSQFKAKNNLLEFTAIPPKISNNQFFNAYQYELKGFSNTNISIIKKNETILTHLEFTKESNGTYTITFQDEIANQNSEFIAFDNSKTNLPIEIKINEVPSEKNSLTDFKSNAEMILIYPKEFESKALEYKTYRNLSLKTEMVCEDNIYSEFNDGNESPVAIKSFIKFAYENWSTNNKLKYVVFLGDAERNYFTGNLKNYVIPTFQFITSKYGIVNSDPYYGYLYNFEEDKIDFNNNPIMDVYIGRIPASNISELDAYLFKLKEYENPNYFGSERSLMLSGNDFNIINNTDQSGNPNRELGTDKRVFLNQVARFNNRIVNENDYTLLRRAAEDPISTTKTALQITTDLQALFNQGLNYVSFSGHGAGSVWGDLNIFLIPDVRNLQENHKYPLVNSFTCFIGAFDGGRTLGEELVLARNKGAIGVLGSSGVSLIYNQYMLGYFVNEFVFKKKYTYGEALSLGKFKFFNKGNNYITDEGFEAGFEHNLNKYLMLLEFNYMGDPSISIKFPKKITLELAKTSISINDTVSFTIKDIPLGNYSGKIELFDYFGEPLFEKNFNLNGITSFTDTLKNLGNLTNQEIYFVKGFLRKSGTNEMYNFGKRIVKDISLRAKNIVLTDPTNHEVQPVNNSDYNVKITTDIEFIRLTCNIRANSFDNKRFDNYSLNFNRQGTTNSYFSLETIRIKEDIIDLDVYDIIGETPQHELKTIHASEIKIKPNKYLIRPVKDSFSVSFTDKIKLSLKIVYPLSFKDSLNVYVSYFRKSLNSKSLLGKDTLNFIKLNSEIISNLNILDTINNDSVVFLAELYTANRLLELDTNNQKIETIKIALPKTIIKAKINDFISLNANLKLHLILNDNNLSADNIQSLANFNFTNTSNTKSLPGKNIFTDKFINVEYFNINFSFINLDSSNFKLLIDKSLWRNFKKDSLALMYFDKSLNNWLEYKTDIVIGLDSILILKINQGFDKSGTYSLIKMNSNIINKYQIDVLTEIDGVKSDSIHYSSINPQIKINLVSKSSNYILNPQNILLQLTDNQNISYPIHFTYNYSGIDNSNLTIQVENIEALNKAGDYHINLKLDGYGIIGKNENGQFKPFINNTLNQDLKITGSDEILIYGNYPNPFGSLTIFSFLLSTNGSSEDIDAQIKIFTFNGFLIKTIDRTNAEAAYTNNSTEQLYSYPQNINVPKSYQNAFNIGTNYYYWNGTDDYGNEVGNGVYFVKFIYKTKENTIEKIIKVAKIKGYN